MRASSDFRSFSIVVVLLLSLGILLICFSLPVVSQNNFHHQSDANAICNEMERTSEDSSGTRKEKVISGTPDDDDDDDNGGDDDDEVQFEKYEPILKINSSRFVKNHPIMVNVSSETPYKGVILQARLVSKGANLGRFVVDRQALNQSNSLDLGHHWNSSMRTIDCGHRHSLHHHSQNAPPPSLADLAGDTLVHWTNQEEGRSTTSYLWIYTGNEDLSGEFVYFVANICSRKTRCWKNVSSVVIPFDRDPIKIDVSECGKTKGCFRYPSGPHGAGCTWSTCQYLLTYHVTGTDAHFEMSGKSAWVAVGFSSDNKMGGDDVFTCVRTRSGVEVRRYVTELGHVTPTLVEKHPFYNMEGSAIGLDWTSNPLNVTLTCRFSRPLKVMYDQSSVDLSTTWYQLYAWGPVSSSDTILRHSLERPLTSNAKVTLKATRNEVSSVSALSSTTLFYPPIFVVVVVVVVTTC